MGEAVRGHGDNFYLFSPFASVKGIPGFVGLCCFFQRLMAASVSIITPFLLMRRNYGRLQLVRISCFNRILGISSNPVGKAKPKLLLDLQSTHPPLWLCPDQVLSRVKASLNEFLWPICFPKIFHHRTGWMQTKVFVVLMTRIFRSNCYTTFLRAPNWFF